MTPKEKAKELVDKTFLHKIPALIAVELLINSTLPSSEFGGIINNNTIEYWEQVKNEIETYNG